MDVRRRQRRVTYTVGRKPGDECCIGGVNCLLSLGGLVASGGRDGCVRLWRPPDPGGGAAAAAEGLQQRPRPGLCACLDEHLDWVNDLCAVPLTGQAPGDARELLASCSNDSQLKLWRLPQPLAESTRTKISELTDLQAAGSTPETPASELTLSPHADYVRRLAWCPSPGLLLSGSFDGTVWAADVEHARQLAPGSDLRGVYQFAELHESVYALAARGSVAAIGTTGPCVRLIDWRSGTLAARLWGHKDLVRDLRWIDPDGSAAGLLCSASSDGTWRLWDERSDRPLASFSVHRSGVWCLQPGLHPLRPHAAESHPLWMLSGGRDGCVMLTACPFSDPDSMSNQSTPLTQSLTPTRQRAGRAAPQACLLASMPFEEAGPPEGVTALALTPLPGEEAQLVWAASPSEATPITVWDTRTAVDALQGALAFPPRPPSTGSQSAAPLRAPLRGIRQLQLGEGSGESEAPPPDGAALELHHLTASVVGRHTYSLACLANPLRAPTPVKQKDAERDAAAQHVQNLGCALAEPLAACPVRAPVVQAQVLANRRHCVSKDSDGRVRLWDLTTAEAVQDYGVCDFEKKCEELAASFPKVALAAWCKVDVTVGTLCVVLDYPSALMCDTTLWEKDTHSPLLPPGAATRPLTHQQLNWVKDELSVNLGEAVLCGLLHRTQAPEAALRTVTDPGDLPLDPGQRREWLHEQRKLPHWGRAAHTAERVQFRIPDHVRVAVWSYRSNPVGGQLPESDRRGEPPDQEVGDKVVCSAAVQPYQPHAASLVGSAAQVYCSTQRDQAGRRSRVLSTQAVPTWVRDVIERGDAAKPQARLGSVHFFLKAHPGGDIPQFGASGGERLTGQRTLRVHNICKQLTNWLGLNRLPFVEEWEGAGKSPAKPAEPPLDLDNLELDTGGLYEAKDQDARWWDVTLVGKNANGTYSAIVHDSTVQADGSMGTRWPSVHVNFVRRKEPERIYPEEFIEVLSYSGHVFDPLCSIGTIDRYHREKGKDLTVYYRKARPKGA
eukprot:TRINITY_DN33514_c0_g1_i1.p1 TRINITY_DN33514_c0_g1~~TRINITY_DN33514_c0_g1_i1.p1  ORF type:complete len:1010 (+),score=293.07 TRINITY_DN33514_c0_g1_i1:108-3137(+)